MARKKSRSQDPLKCIPKHKAKYIRKLANRLKKLNGEELALPLDKPIVEVVILYKGDAASWYHDQGKEDCKILIRVEDMDDEGLGCHLNEDAKVFQWILWQPLLGENSKAHPERCWREDNFPTPGEFLASKISGKYRREITKLCSSRWDTAMMLGGADQVSSLIDQHIRADNLSLRTAINTWMKGKKWHQEWDWEGITEAVLFSTGHGFDIYWESDKYGIPQSFKPLVVWSRDSPDVIDNMKASLDNLPPVPGCESLSVSPSPVPELNDAGKYQSTLTAFVGSAKKPASSGKLSKKKSMKQNAVGNSIKNYLKPKQPNATVEDAIKSLRYWSAFNGSGTKRRKSPTGRTPKKVKKPKRGSRKAKKSKSPKRRSRSKSSKRRTRSRSKKPRRSRSKSSRRKSVKRSKGRRRSAKRSKSRRRSSKRSRKKLSRSKSRRRSSKRSSRKSKRSRSKSRKARSKSRKARSKSSKARSKSSKARKRSKSKKKNRSSGRRSRSRTAKRSKSRRRSSSKKKSRKRRSKSSKRSKRRSRRRSSNH